MPNAITTTNPGYIFRGRGRSKKNKLATDILRKSTVTDSHYDMFVIPVTTLLTLSELAPHQDMLKTGQLVRATPEHIGKIIFVSHEWSGNKS